MALYVKKISGKEISGTGGGGGITDGDKGDITVSSGGTVWNINNDAVVTAKILDLNVTTIKIADDAVTDSKIATNVVTGKLLTGLSIIGSSILSTDSILIAFGKLQNQINGVLGGAIYQGVWNANTNSPLITSSVGTQGYYYVVSVDGSTNIDGITDWKVGDWIIFNGTTWDKVDNTDAISSFNGSLGAISYTPQGTTDRITVTGASGLSPTFGISATFEALLGKVANPLSQFAPTTSAQLAGVITDETGTGVVVYNTSPTIATSLLTSSTTFSLLNTVATTINFAGATTTLNIARNTVNTTVNIGNSVEATNGGITNIFSDVLVNRRSPSTLNTQTFTTTTLRNANNDTDGNYSSRLDLRISGINNANNLTQDRLFRIEQFGRNTNNFNSTLINTTWLRFGRLPDNITSYSGRLAIGSTGEYTYKTYFETEGNLFFSTTTNLLNISESNININSDSTTTNLASKINVCYNSSNQINYCFAGKNELSTGITRLAILNNNNTQLTMQVYGSSFATTFYADKATLLSSKSLILSSSNSESLYLIAGSILNNPTVEITSGSPGVVDIKGNCLIGATTGTDARLKIGGSTTALSQINFVSGATKSSPIDGDLWFESSNQNLKFRKTLSSARTMNIMLNTGTTSTSATTGSASPLPALPESYLEIEIPNVGIKKIAYYN